MRPLRRVTADSRTTDLDTRVTALERRFYEPASLWATVYFTTPQSVAAGSSVQLTFDSFETNAPNDFTTLPNLAAGDTAVTCAIFGIYLAVALIEFEPDAVGYPHQMQIQPGRQRVTQLSNLGAGAAAASDLAWTPTGGVLSVGDVLIGVHSAWDYLPSQVASWELFAANFDTVDRDATRGSMTVTLLSADERNKNPVVY